MPEDLRKTFEDTLENTLRTERSHGFRVCVDEKDNMSVSELIIQELGFMPVCPSGTKKTIDVLMTPTILKNNR